MKLRALIVAPCLDGDDVGEAWSSFQWVQGLAEKCEVTVLGYHKRGHRPISEQLPQVRVIEWRDLPFVGRWERMNSMLKPGYLAFYLRARRWIRKATSRGERFDVGHQLAPLAARYPSPLAGQGIPWILGPLAGSLSTPTAFQPNSKAPWFMKLRELDSFRVRWDPMLRGSIMDARQVVCVAPYMQEVLRDVPLRNPVMESETGILEVPSASRSQEKGPPRLLYVGRIVRTKGLLHGLRALGGIQDRPWTLDVLGAGEDEAACKAAVLSAGIGDRVRFHGVVSRDRVGEFYSASDIFLFPSYREPSGNVVLEAMSHGLCVLCCNRGGPGHAVQSGRGVKVDAHHPSQLEAQLSSSLRALFDSPERVAEYGESARDYIASHAIWPAKINRMYQLYQRVSVPS